MAKPIMLGILGLIVGYAIYLLIYLLFLPAGGNSTLGALLAIVVGVIFFFIGRRSTLKKVPK